MQYAYFDSAVAQPSPVLGWLDHDFPNPPNAVDLLALTPDQWAARSSGLWAVQGGTLVAYSPASTATQLWDAYKNSALAAIADSDKTLLRVTEAVALGLTTWATADVVAWADYRRALRVIVGTTSGTAGTLPPKPPYPAGT